MRIGTGLAYKSLAPRWARLLFSTSSWSCGPLKSTSVSTGLLKSTSSWSCAAGPHNDAAPLPALLSKAARPPPEPSPTGGRFQYRQVQLEAENSKTACTKLDFSRPNSNWRPKIAPNSNWTAISAREARACSDPLSEIVLGPVRLNSSPALSVAYTPPLPLPSSAACFL